MRADCHIHMILDGVWYRDAMDRHKEAPEEVWIRSCLEEYDRRGICWLRDGGDRWQVSLTASRLAEEYGITYRTPVFPICRAGHYGSFIGRGFSDLKEYQMLIREVKRQGGHFVKLMVSGIMDFSQYGMLTDTPCEPELCKDLIAAAHDAGFSVMVHANGDAAVTAALQAGADSIEHGAYLEEETLHLLAESGAVWVPTVVTVERLIGSGRYPDRVLKQILSGHLERIRRGAQLGAVIALGTDAGAWGVFHGAAVEQEYALLQQALGEHTEKILSEGENTIRHKF